MNELVEQLRQMTGRLDHELHEIRSIIWELEGLIKRQDEEITQLKESAALKELAQATGPEALRAALSHWTPEELAKAGIV